MLWQLRDRALDLAPRALVMGIVNVTPDSFSDGGRFFDPAAAVAHGLRLAGEGADLLDVGGESSRPGASPVPLDEELRRVVPVVRELARRTAVPISVDTVKAEVARRCLAEGAQVVNDITALGGDPAMAEVCRAADAGVVLMHMRGTPQTMQIDPTYGDVVGEVRAALEVALKRATQAGIAASRLVLDPGLGFGKTVEHNLDLLANLGRLADLGRPLLLGVSRKGLLGVVTGRARDERLASSLAAAAYALAHGGVRVVRVHDVAATFDLVRVYAALDAARSAPAAQPI